MNIFLNSLAIEDGDFIEECITVKDTLDDNDDVVLFDISNKGVSLWWDFIFEKDYEPKIIGVDAV